jgi:hypothetical protein
MFISVETLDFERYGRSTLINTEAIESAFQALGAGGSPLIVLRMRSGAVHSVSGSFHKLARVLDAQHPSITTEERAK